MAVDFKATKLYENAVELKRFDKLVFPVDIMYLGKKIVG